MRKIYVVRLTNQEREQLTQVVKKLKGSSQKVRRAQMLLKADADGPAWTDQADCRRLGLSSADGGECPPAAGRTRV